MNYEILNGRSMKIGSSHYHDIKIRKETGLSGTIYYINDIMVPKMEIVLAIGEIERLDQNTESKNNFGIFVLKRKVLPVEMKDSERGMLFGMNFGVREYAFDKCGVFGQIRFGNTSFELEICWKHKKAYVEGNFPDSYVKYTKLV